MNSFIATSISLEVNSSGSPKPDSDACRQLLLLAHGGAGDVDGDVAAADDHDLLADGEAVAKIHVQEKIDAFHDAVEFVPR